jgi:hypothetical protein
MYNNLILATRNYYFSLLLLIFVSSQAIGQPPPKMKVDVPASLKSFIPRGYEALDLSTGDLNGDAYPDAVLILYKKGEEKTSDVISHPEKRPLLLMIGQANKTYKIAARSDNAVYCLDCGGQMGDPFMGVTIKNGYFSVEHYGGSGWRWTRIVTFKYSPADKNWFLHKDGGERFNAISKEEVKTTVKTVKNFGKVPFQKFDIYKE